MKNKKRWLAFAGILCAVMLVVMMGRTGTLRSEEQQEPGVTKKADGPVERPVFISVPEIFEALERAPVLFKHDTHAIELEAEGCEVCHPTRDGKVLFTYPKERDETSRDALMNAFHDACIGCHNERSAEGKDAGPVTCGECHVIEDSYLAHEYLPILPEYYEPLRDTYHRDCLSCHQDPAKAAEDAGGLDWKRFYVKERQKIEDERPEVFFDYLVHDKHEKALEDKCELCHYISPGLQEKLDREQKEPSCQDWLREIEEGGSLVEEDQAHSRCINCHLERADEKKDAGPVHCKKCHTDIERTVEELADVPRQDCDQEETILIQIEEEDVRMKGVPFSHTAHQADTRGCQDCHHDTLEACKTCHTLTGDEKGDYITLAEAYHEETSAWSCIGCHETEKKKPDCAGCHHIMKTGLNESACDTCHTGTLESLDNATKIAPPAELYPEDMDQEMEISILENEYKPAKLTHEEIVKKLSDISDNSTLARHFHTEKTTICQGCHHLGPVEEKKNPPQCSTCHTARKEPERKVPTLLGAYHQQCLGCHKQMGGTEEEMPQSCSGCHEEKQAPAAGK